MCPKEECKIKINIANDNLRFYEGEIKRANYRMIDINESIIRWEELRIQAIDRLRALEANLTEVPNFEEGRWLLVANRRHIDNLSRFIREEQEERGRLEAQIARYESQIKTIITEKIELEKCCKMS